jgi:hypothetical protein
MARPRKTTRVKARPRKTTASAKTSAERDDGPLDPRAVALIAALRADPRLAAVARDFEAARAAPSRKFGSNGLKVNGKLFALFTQGTLVVKLPRDRVAALVAAKVGKPFDPGHGRLMKEWLTVTEASAPWIVLVREAHAFVGG